MGRLLHAQTARRSCHAINSPGRWRWLNAYKTKAAVKLHTLIDLRGSIPTFVAVTPGKVPDVKMLDQMPVCEDAIYTMDRGYVDFARLTTTQID